MTMKVLSAGQKIEMTRYVRGTAKESLDGKRTYVSKLLDLNEKEELIIAMPMEGGKMVLLEVGDRYNMYFYTPSGMYYCVAQVNGRFRTGNVFMLKMECVSEIEKFQRRQFFRLNCIVDMTYRRAETENITKKSVIIDISGGGVRFNSDEQYQAGEVLLLEFWLNTAGKLHRFHPKVKVITSIKLQNRERGYENRVEFVDIREDERESIVKYIFEEERRRRKRESGL